MWPFKKSCEHDWTEWEDYNRDGDVLFYDYLQGFWYSFRSVGKTRWCKKCAKKDCVIWEQKRVRNKSMGWIDQ